MLTTCESQLDDLYRGNAPASRPVEWEMAIKSLKQCRRQLVDWLDK
jgi:hypothetical protein